MNIFKLTGTALDGTEGLIWACGVCKHIAVNKDMAERCCTCHVCNTPLNSDELKTPYYSCIVCRQNEELARQVKDKEKEDSAEIVENYDGPVYCSRLDKYESCLEDMYDYWMDRVACDRMDEVGYDKNTEFSDAELETGIPEFVYCCDSNPVCALDLDDIVNILDNGDLPEDMEISDLEGFSELEKALQEFNEKNKDVVVWMPNEKKKVRLKRL